MCHLNSLSSLHWLGTFDRLDRLEWVDRLDRSDWLDVLNWLVNWLECLDVFYTILNRLNSVGSLDWLHCSSCLCSVKSTY